MNVKTIFAAAATSVMALSSAAFAGGPVAVVDCNVTPNAAGCEQVAVVPAASPSSAGLGGLGIAGIAAGVVGVAVLAAVLSNNDDDDDSSASTTTDTSLLSQ